MHMCLTLVGILRHLRHAVGAGSRHGNTPGVGRWCDASCCRRAWGVWCQILCAQTVKLLLVVHWRNSFGGPALWTAKRLVCRDKSSRKHDGTATASWFQRLSITTASTMHHIVSALANIWGPMLDRCESRCATVAWAMPRQLHWPRAASLPQQAEKFMVWYTYQPFFSHNSLVARVGFLSFQGDNLAGCMNSWPLGHN